MKLGKAGLRAGGNCHFCQKGFENHEYWCSGGCTAQFKTRLVGFCGGAGCGKTTAAKRLVSHWRFQRLPFAAPLKAMLAALGLTEAQLNGDLKEQPIDEFCGKSPRQLMQSLGTEWGRNLVGADFWAQAWARAVNQSPCQVWSKPPSHGPDRVRLVVVDDVRFANEANLIRSMGGKIIRIHKPDKQPPQDQHISEAQAFTADAEIVNDADRVDLHHKVDQLALSLMK